MPDLQRVHRFRDYAVAGVNWRPTRFVDEVPSSRVCGLCRMIPKRILVLPCGHVLCQPCHAASSQGGRCPLDQEPFEEAECCVHDFPMRKAKTLKVHCWNEEHGCEFVGAIEDMLKHNETECDYHAVECLRCGEKVLHRELSTHYVAGCTAAVSPAVTENPSLESDALTLQDVIASLEEVKTLLRDPDYDELLPEIQSKTNEPAERLANQGSHMTATRGVGESARIAKVMVSKVAATTSSTASQEPASRRNPPEQTSTSSSSLSCSEKPIVPQKLDFFTNLPADVLENMRKTSSRDYRQYAANRERKTSSRGYPQFRVVMRVMACSSVSVELVCPWSLFCVLAASSTKSAEGPSLCSDELLVDEVAQRPILYDQRRHVGRPEL
ncbi:hypothetical protein HPB52_015802 [Rhipicephalus sanguineus]|uniref:RING-type domain-containing protein n=1 Tax=Rhipicephalus sanguineus TaxID=34632 RepID=A0A9D4T7X2_RHISA|nr:hypothetical protein HPB52_015802 [Rhipicephalus sanguineus]